MTTPHNARHWPASRQLTSRFFTTASYPFLTERSRREVERNRQTAIRANEEASPTNIPPHRLVFRDRER